MRYLAFLLALTLALPFPALAWAPGAGSTDLGGGWTVDTSTAGTLSFKYNGTETERHTANGLVIPRLALSASMASALPTYAGCGWFYPNAADGNVIAHQVTFTGSPNSDDRYAKWGSDVYLTGYSAMSSLKYLSTYGYYGSSDATAATFEKGLVTGVGRGILVGGAAASVPTTNAVDFAYSGSSTVPASTGRLHVGTDAVFTLRGVGAAYAGLYGTTITGATAVNSAAFRNAAGTGTPTLTYGFSVPAGYGGTFVGGAKPTAPAAGSIILHGGLEAGVAVLSVEKAAATTHIVTITP